MVAIHIKPIKNEEDLTAAFARLISLLMQNLAVRNMMNWLCL